VAILLAVLELAVLVASIGLADSLNPSTIAPALVLATGTRPCVRVASFTAGAFIVSFLGGLLIVLGPGQLLLDALPHPSPNAKHVAELIGGVILLGAAAALWLGRRHVHERISGGNGGSQRGAKSALALGAGIMAVELPTAAPYFAAIAAIIGSRSALHNQVVLLVLFNIAFVVPLLVILAVRAFAGPRAVAALRAADVWLRVRAAALLSGLLGLSGAALVIVGLAGLL